MLKSATLAFLIPTAFVVPCDGQPVITRSPVPQSVSVGANVTLSVASAGAAPFRYQWLKAAEAISNATNASLQLKAIQLSDAGAYSVRVIDAAGLSTESQSATLVVDPTFTKVTTGRIVEDREQSDGCAFSDYNGDGFLDLYVSNFRAPGALYRNNQDGTFIRITSSPFSTDSSTSHGCAWADVDNDGWPDLYVSNIGTANWLYRNLGNGQFQKASTSMAGAVLLNPDDRSIGHAWADIDRDGLIDLFVPNGGIVLPLAENRLFRNLGNGYFTNAIPGSVVEKMLVYSQGVWADYDNDGEPDLFVTAYLSGGNSLFRNDGGAFTRVSEIAGVDDSGFSIGAAWGDYNNDSFPDLIVTNRRSGANTRNFLYRNRGDGTFEKILEGPVATDGGIFLGCSWADYDNDGFLDLFVTTEDQRRAFYHNNGDGTFTRLTEGSVVNDISHSPGCAWGDINNDGFIDLFMANGSITGPQVNSLYINNGNSNSWIKVRGIGTLSNRSAIGAKVRVKSSIGGREQWQLREISGGSGYLSQDAPEASFGLGDASVVSTLRVEWPSGIVEEYHDLPVKQALTVTEPLELKRANRRGTTLEFTLNASTSRTFTIEASTNLRHWSALGSAMATNGIIQVSDSESETLRHRFYRAMVP